MRTLEEIRPVAADAARIVSLPVADVPRGATIVLLEPEPLLADSIKYTLEREGFRVVAPAGFEVAVEIIQRDSPALVLAELPGSKVESEAWCRTIKASSTASIILMTPPVTDAQRMDVLQAGADELLIKPFSVREVVHRVAHHIRSEQTPAWVKDSEAEILRVGPVEMDVAHHEVKVRGTLTIFPPKEFGLLEILLRSRGRLLTRTRLLASVWGADYYGDGKTLDTHVKRLRQKIELDPKVPVHLVVVRGLGYRFLEAGR